MLNRCQLSLGNSPCRMVYNDRHLYQIADCGPYVVEIIVNTKSCSGCAPGNTEQGLQVKLTGLLGLTECTTNNLDNLDAHDYGSGSVAHFGKDSGLGGCWVSWPFRSNRTF